MNKDMLRSFMVARGETQEILADALGISLSRFNAKLNETGGAEFKKSEMECIKRRYNLDAQTMDTIFFA